MDLSILASKQERTTNVTQLHAAWICWGATAKSQKPIIQQQVLFSWSVALHWFSLRQHVPVLKAERVLWSGSLCIHSFESQTCQHLAKSSVRNQQWLNNRVEALQTHRAVLVRYLLIIIQCDWTFGTLLEMENRLCTDSAKKCERTSFIKHTDTFKVWNVAVGASLSSSKPVTLRRNISKWGYTDNR